MKLFNIYILLSAFAMHSAVALAGDKITLSGKVTDKATGEPLPGVTIYITDLKTGATSGPDGRYKIENLPRARVSVQVSFVGYKLIVETVDLNTASTKDFAMEETVAELHEIVVTGLSRSEDKNRIPAPITSIGPAQLMQSASSNIIDALARQPGVSQVTTGSGISKPVIRGLGYNRVVVVNDGIRQEGQQWGDEHGIEIDEFAVNKVEILKGPASLTYGSDAIAGVINMLSAPTLPEGTMTGSVLANYQTNNGLFGYSANLAGNRKGLIWDVRYSNKRAHAYKNKYDGYVYNSGFRENTISGIIGLNKSWGYSHLHFSAYHLTPAIVEGERDSATGQFLKPVAIDAVTEGAVVATDKDFKSYDAATPYQQVSHYKAVLNNSFVVGNGSLKATLGIQQNRRQEYADVLNPDGYGLYFLLNTVNYDVRYILPEKNNFNISVGANGMQQASQNKGSEFLIPDYNLFDIGVFGIVKKTMGRLDVSGGLRYDSRSEEAEDLYLDADGNKTGESAPGATQRFNAFHSTFTGVSGSLGATYQFSEEVFTKFNVARGYRAPNIAELASNGEHEGTLQYIRGVSALKPENSMQADVALGFNFEHVTAEVDLFSNHISNYIFLRKLESTAGGDSLTDGLSTFTYASGDATLSGGEFIIDIHPHPLDWLHFENSFSYVSAVQKNQPDSTKYLPFTPAPKITSELKATTKKLGTLFSNAYIRAGVDYYFRQDRVYSAYETETPTSAYALFHAGAGADVNVKKKTLFSFYINVDNLADVAYQSHLSRLKYAPVNNLTGRAGVFNMGRNISFKIVVPFDLSKSTDS